MTDVASLDATGTTTGVDVDTPDDSSETSGIGVAAIVTTLFALVGWIVGSARLGDNSFFWHVRTGEHILDHGFPHGDVFSYTAPGTRWIAQSWLAEVAYAAIGRSVGDVGIRLFIGLVGATVSVLAFRLTLRFAGSVLRAAGIAGVSLAGVFAIWSERPLVIGLLFLLVLIWTVEVPDTWAGRHAIFVVPVVIYVWANVHGSFALGLAYLGLHVVGRWVDGAPPWLGRERSLVIGTALGVALSLINPYGTSLLTFPVELLSRGEILSHVIEWQSPSFRAKWGIAFALWIAVFVCAIARGRHRVTRRDLIVTIPMVLLALWAARNIAIAPLVGMPVIARAFASEPKRGPSFSRPFIVVACGAIALVGVMLAASAAGEKAYAFDTYPVKSMRYLERHDLLGERLLTDDADAGYVINQYWPKQRVFMDDRFDMFPVKLIHDFFTVSGGEPGWQRVLDDRKVDVVVWRNQEPLASLLNAADGWTRIHRDKTHSVWVRDGSAADQQS
ncbi:MAG: hypothetical protein ABWY80_00595 [Acidimicrobiia bacterium]